LICSCDVNDDDGDGDDGALVVSLLLVVVIDDADDDENAVGAGDVDVTALLGVAFCEPTDEDRSSNDDDDIVDNVEPRAVPVPLPLLLPVPPVLPALLLPRLPDRGCNDGSSTLSRSSGGSSSSDVSADSSSSSYPLLPLPLPLAALLLSSLRIGNDVSVVKRTDGAISIGKQ
jgi:hypothetical protein